MCQWHHREPDGRSGKHELAQMSQEKRGALALSHRPQERCASLRTLAEEGNLREVRQVHHAAKGFVEKCVIEKDERCRPCEHLIPSLTGFKNHVLLREL